MSYASTGTALSDKTLYDLFARTVPSDMFQARAIADIVHKFNWKYVSLVSSEGLYGDSGSKEFAKQASFREICIATHEKIPPTADYNAYDGIVQALYKRNATGVVLFTRAEDTKELLLAVKRAKLLNKFSWVAADGWGTHQNLVDGVEEVAWGAITVELQAKAIPGFDDYMKSLTPWVNQRNPWFSEYWQQWFQCQLQPNLVYQQQVASGLALAASKQHQDSMVSSSSAWSNKIRDSYMNDDVGSDVSSDGYDESMPIKPSSTSFAQARRKRRHRHNNSPYMIGNNINNNQDDNSNGQINTKRGQNCSIKGGFSSNGQDLECSIERETERELLIANHGTSNSNRNWSESLASKNEDNLNRFEATIAIEQQQLASISMLDPKTREQTWIPSDSVRNKRSNNISNKINQTVCSPNLRISETNGYRQEQKVQFVVDAVYAMAHALHNAWTDLCSPQPGVCDRLKELNGKII